MNKKEKGGTILLQSKEVKRVDEGLVFRVNSSEQQKLWNQSEDEEILMYTMELMERSVGY